MRILLHICCANCAIFPFQRILANGDEAVGFFFNPNIHPYQEYQKRLEALKVYSDRSGLNVIYRDEYLLEEFLREVSHRVEERCSYCYSLRLGATAREAQKNSFDAFSTTLLQSTHQNHLSIKEIGERIGREIGIPFYYEDFRPGWKTGVEISKAMGLYRQQYCGCIYSEKERFIGKTKMANAKFQSSKEIQTGNTKEFNLKKNDFGQQKKTGINFESREGTQSSGAKIFDLEERTARFGEEIIEFVKTLEKNEVNHSLINQLIRAVTSIGANYMEADGAESKKDFVHKMAICKKESKESKHWIRMIRRANPQRSSVCNRFWQEAHELTLIFSSICLSKKKEDLNV